MSSGKVRVVARRSADFDLVAKLPDPGFTPSARDVPELLGFLAGGDPDLRASAEKALRRTGAVALHAAIERAQTEEGEARARLTGLVGRLAGSDERAHAFLLQAVGDQEPNVRRRAAMGLSRRRADGEVDKALSSALERESHPVVRRALIEALGKVGGTEAEAALRELTVPNEATPVLQKARIRAARGSARSETSEIDVAQRLGSPIRIHLECRRGLLPVLLEEASGLNPKIAHRIDGSSVLSMTLNGTFDEVFAFRTWLGVALAGEAVSMERAGEDEQLHKVAEAVVRGSARAGAVALTRGPLRYRIAWGAGGKRRAAVYKLAEAISALDPALINDPSEPIWQVVVREARGRVAADWEPSLVDPRFSYRSGDVPAASHPTIAAALAYVAGTRRSDVVWDPFVGSGLELCERALRGPYRQLVGTDIEERALSVARENLTGAGAAGFDLFLHDAAKGVPKGLAPTLVITNPPMGRRVHRQADLRGLLTGLVKDVGRALKPLGRLVWVSPFPSDTREAARSAGLEMERAHVVDMGGFDAEIQVLSKRGA